MSKHKVLELDREKDVMEMEGKGTVKLNSVIQSLGVYKMCSNYTERYEQHKKIMKQGEKCLQWSASRMPLPAFRAELGQL